MCTVRDAADGNLVRCKIHMQLLLCRGCISREKHFGVSSFKTMLMWNSTRKLVEDGMKLITLHNIELYTHNRCSHYIKLQHVHFISLLCMINSIWRWNLNRFHYSSRVFNSRKRALNDRLLLLVDRVSNVLLIFVLHVIDPDFPMLLLEMITLYLVKKNERRR